MILSQQDFLLAWGWNEYFNKQITADIDPTLRVGRVVGEEKNRWRVQLSEQQCVWAELSGRFRFESRNRDEIPSVGDWILCKYAENQSVALVEQVLERKSCLYRKAVGGGEDKQILASNIDWAFIVTSANADFNLARLDRYLSLAWDSGAIPVILITKSDLHEGVAELASTLSEEFPGVDIVPVSVFNGSGLEGLQKYLRSGSSSVFIGSSGVGKSTLVNYLLGEDHLKTQGVREGDDRGRHTTTSRYLFRNSLGALVIDTPGMRELALYDQEEGFENHFSDVEELVQQCRFHDCEHRTEPGCAVLQALENGELESERWLRYIKIARELHRQKMKNDKAHFRQERERSKKLQRIGKENYKMKRGGMT